MNLFFLGHVEKHQIIVLILLPHSIYRLQLLDVDLFSSFSKAYAKKLSDFMMKDQGFISFNKRMFYSFFKWALEIFSI